MRPSVYSKETKYMILKTKYSNWKFIVENVQKFKYLGVTITNTNDIREEIKRRINMGNACYYSLEKILSSRLLSEKLKVSRIRLHIKLLYYQFYYMAVKLRLTFWKRGRGLGRFENEVFRKISGEEMKLQENWESYLMLSYINCIHLT